MNMKVKNRFDAHSKRGLVYAGIALLGMGYELIFADEVRLFLIIMYGIVIGIGGLYIYFIEDID